MPRSFVRSRPVVRGPKRRTIWIQFQPAITTMTATGGTLIFSLNAAALALRPFTIVRSRFELYLKSDQDTASEDQVAGFGIAVVSDEAAAVGVTAIPTPITELGSDLWFVNQILMSSIEAGATNVETAINGRGWTVDSKAMRKCSVGQNIVVVGERAGAGSGVELFAGGRILIKVG